MNKKPVVISTIYYFFWYDCGSRYKNSSTKTKLNLNNKEVYQIAEVKSKRSHRKRNFSHEIMQLEIIIVERILVMRKIENCIVNVKIARTSSNLDSIPIENGDKVHYLFLKLKYHKIQITNVKNEN